jgi:hypothetical protein
MIFAVSIYHQPFPHCRLCVISSLLTPC